jgi:hypothetical protein
MTGLMTEARSEVTRAALDRSDIRRIVLINTQPLRKSRIVRGMNLSIISLYQWSTMLQNVHA